MSCPEMRLKTLSGLFFEVCSFFVRDRQVERRAVAEKRSECSKNPFFQGKRGFPCLVSERLPMGSIRPFKRHFCFSLSKEQLPCCSADFIAALLMVSLKEAVDDGRFKGVLGGLRRSRQKGRAVGCRFHRIGAIRVIFEAKKGRFLARVFLF